MFNLDTFKQKSPQQRFLFILGVAMIIIFFVLAVVIVFFGELINLDPQRFPQKYRIAFGVVLVVYAAIRFFRIIRDNKE
jgi:undecaprenyl pyrophosphate phosphatase UppP